jgi:hypothetical protein
MQRSCLSMVSAAKLVIRPQMRCIGSPELARGLLSVGIDISSGVLCCNMTYFGRTVTEFTPVTVR